MKRRILSFFLAAVMIFTMAACGKQITPAPSTTEAAVSSTPPSTAPSTEATTTEAATTDATTEPPEELPDAQTLLKGALDKAFSSKSFSYFSDEVYLSMLAGYVAELGAKYYSYGEGDDYIATYTQTISESDETGEIVTITITEDFIDGVYHFSRDDTGESDSDTESSPQVIRASFLAALSEPDIVWEWLEEVTVEDLGNRYYICFTYSQEYSDDLEEWVCDTMNISVRFIRNLVQGTEMDAWGYAVVEKETGSLLAYNEHVSFSYLYNGNTYEQYVDSYISMTPEDPDAYKEITGERAPLEEPENKATPLFYHVTGDNGQEMWLLGSIHIGDTRTCFLPAEIYAALDTSDAVAVEVDMNKMDELMEEDPDFSAAIQQYYYYDDGSSIQDHVAPQVYTDAVESMKKSGSYRYFMNNMTAAIWSTSLDQSQLNLSPLSYAYGVDQQIIDRAYEKNIPVISLEAFEDHLSIGLGCSDRLQELLLISSIETDHQEYMDDCQDMFERWCRGDEADLIAYFNEEDNSLEDDDIPDGFTREEVESLNKEYQEYMIGNRNPEMAKKAVEFLESGDVVFYCVGLAHVIGEDNLVDYLRNAGYTVEPVVYANP